MYSTTIVDFCVMFIAVIQLWLMLMTMFRWKTGFGRDILNLEDKEANATAPLARYLGFHSGMLAFLLVASTIMIQDPNTFAQNHWAGLQLQKYTLECIAAAGIFGGLFSNRKLFLLQAAPALIGMFLIYWYPR